MVLKIWSHINGMPLESLKKLPNGRPCLIVDPKRLVAGKEKSTIRAVFNKNPHGVHISIEKKKLVRIKLSMKEREDGASVLPEPLKGDALFSSIEELHKCLEELSYEIL